MKRYHLIFCLALAAAAGLPFASAQAQTGKVTFPASAK